MRRLPQYVVISRKALLLPRRGCRLALLQLVLLGASRCLRLLLCLSGSLSWKGCMPPKRERGPRGGKKTVRARELAEAYARGEYQPVHGQSPSSETGLARAKAAFKAAASSSSSIVPEASSSVVSTSELDAGVEVEEIVTTSVRSLTKSTVTRPQEYFEPVLSVSSPPSKASHPSSSSVGDLASSSSPVFVVGKESETTKTPPKQGSLKRSIAEAIPVKLGPDSSRGRDFVRPKVSQATGAEVRVSVDYNGVLNVGRAGDSECDGLHPNCERSLRAFIGEHHPRGIKVGVTSYIGLKGRLSQSRRRDLLSCIREFNINQSLAEKVGVRIVSDRKDKASFCNSSTVSYHIDDRVDVLNEFQGSGIHTILIARKGTRSRFHTVLSSLPEALEFIAQSRFEPKICEKRFENCWLIP